MTRPQPTAMGSLRVPGSRVLGRYDLIERIAIGGMAEVYLGNQVTENGIGRRVVVKRILPHLAAEPEFVKLFTDEARLAMRLSHSHVAYTLDCGTEQGEQYLVLEYVDGPSLHTLQRKRGIQVPMPVALRIVASVASALAYAHGLKDEQGQCLGVVHRDVSPHNIVVGRDGAVKLIDFGIAKARDQLHLTEAGMVRGKFGYMAPEQLEGRPADPRTDVFSLCAVLWELLAGQRLFPVTSLIGAHLAVCGKPRPRLRDYQPALDENLEAIVQKGLAHGPNARWASASDLETALEQYLTRQGLVVSSQHIAQLVLSLDSPIGHEVPGPHIEERSPRPTGDPDEKPLRELARLSSDLSEAPTVAGPRPSGGSEPKPSGPNSSVLRELPLLSSDLSEAPTVMKPRPSVGAELVSPMSKLEVLDVLARPNALSEAPTVAKLRPSESTESRASTQPALEIATRITTQPAHRNLRTPILAAILIVLAAGLASAGWLWRNGDGPRLAAQPLEQVVHAQTGQTNASPPPSSTRPTLGPIVSGATNDSDTGRAPVGQVSLRTQPRSRVYVQGRFLGSTPLDDVSFPAGAHVFTFVTDGGARVSREIVIREGVQADLSFDLR